MFPKWLRSRCIRGWAVALVATGFLTTTTYAKPLPKLLAEVESKYSRSLTLSADFSQVIDDVLLHTKKASSGKIFVKRPLKFRWETEKPEKNLLVSNGKFFWFYTPPFDEGEKGQVIERKSSDVQSKLANALLSGSFSAARDMIIVQKSASVFELNPKKGTAGTVTQAVVEIDPEKKLIQKVILTHKGGNRSEITLSQIRVGEPLEDSLFVFQAPPNTDLVRE